MALKKRILQEMVVDSQAIEIFRELPSELKTTKNLDKIQSKIRSSGASRQ